jgi:hypothetical protein
MATELEHSNACRKWQEYFDNHLRDVGGKASPFIPGQVEGDYVRESCRTFKRTFLPQNHELYKVNYRGLRGDALHVLVPQLMKACKEEAENPRTVAPGEFRQISKRDEYGVLKEIQFVGPECFVKRMSRPGRLAKIRTPDTHPGWFPKEVPSAWVSGRSAA